MLLLDERAQVVTHDLEHATHAGSVARRAASALVGFALLAACSTGGEDDTTLDDVASRLRDLERATLSLEVVAGETGFRVDGAFSVSGERPLPVAQLTYEPIDGSDATTVVLTGSDGFVVVDEQAYRLPPAQLDTLRIPSDGAASAVSAIRLRRWFEVEQAEDGVYEGPGDVDVVLDDVVALASGLGAGDVAPGRVDGPMRVRLVAEDDADLRELHAEADDFRFVLELSDHGEPVEVDAPEDALPFEELGR